MRRGRDHAPARGDRCVEHLAAADLAQRAHDARLRRGEQERQLGERLAGLAQRAEDEPRAREASQLGQAPRDVEAGAPREAVGNDRTDQTERRAQRMRDRQRQRREQQEEGADHGARIIPCGPRLAAA